MIPKIIHYCWFGRGKLSPMAEMCIDSWRKYCPDYVIKCWNEDNSPMDHSWIKEAYRHQKYAFVADFVRFYALYHEGGVYMDTDMLLIMPIDELLKDRFFLGRESAQYASMGIIGSEKGNEFAKICLDLYNQTAFNFLKPPVIPHFIKPYLTQVGLTEENTTQHLQKGIVVYQSDYFYPIPSRNELERYDNVLDAATPNTYGIHLWNMSWRDEVSIIRQGQVKKGLKLVWQRLKRTPFLPIGYWVKVIKACLSTTWIGTIYHNTKNDSK